MNKETRKKFKLVLLYITGIELVRLALANLISGYLKANNKIIFYSLGYGIGDQVCMTALPKTLHEKFKVVVVSDFPEIFEGNPYVYKNIKLNRGTKKIANILLNIFKGNRVVRFHSKKRISQVCKEDRYKDISLIKLHSLDFSSSLGLELQEATVDIHFTNEEIIKFQDKFKSLPKDYGLIMPNAKIDYTPNKSWCFDRFQEVVEKLSDFSWVQIGAAEEKILKGVCNLTGKTASIKELAYVIKNAKFILSTEGLFNHISSAFNTPSFVVFSGFHHIEIANYKNTIPIVRNPQVACAPCYLTTPCPFEKKICTEEISVAKVVSKINENLKTLSR